ncbi:hypothetical protein TUM19329_22070 [Legionella antarctica]|uniref:Uncharacterized protein n=1 Tax=Legionella antarctica TaxID=2708020 RepID=A0A6F8T7A4_9GAMM|nr:hypothetical protein [Legionella antarctica]BCA95846.1 hypothetical protein TUM19329_22070 [Legionella antarctica]
MNFSLDEKRVMIDPLAELTIREQCLLLDLPVSSYYYSAMIWVRMSGTKLRKNKSYSSIIYS